MRSVRGNNEERLYFANAIIQDFQTALIAVIHTRYFAVRDSKGNYRGTLEVSQDVTSIRGLEGNKRLLDWDCATVIGTVVISSLPCFG